ncbi:MAG: type II toxin-antitoxin system prevent-host-death family antitoxin [Candidatus Gottesmanbacteria bacterium]|nr:type II toxin-antitoxin system prevent-host-death family antitoxin [Candidatus Gottesmanbacteria bacterium]
MQQVTVSWAREEWAQLVNRVFAGEEFLVVKNNIPVARLLPVEKTAPTVHRKKILPAASTLLSHFTGTAAQVGLLLRQRAWRTRT